MRRAAPPAAGEVVEVAGCTLLRLPEHADPRGLLAVAEPLPFTPSRLFLIHSVPAGARRGGHAHRRLHELMLCTGGSVTVELDDGTERVEVVLDHPTLALHVPPSVWSAEREFTPGATLVVLASGPYDPDGAVADRDALPRRQGDGR